MKVCAFGNSYMIAIKDAVEDSALNGSVTFVGGTAGKWSVSVAGDVVEPGPDALLFFAEGKGPDILLSDYDAFLIIGLRLSLQVATKIYCRRRRLWHHAAKEHHIISEKALHSAIKDLLSHTLAVDLARSLRQHTDKPIFLIPQPNPIEEIKSLALTTDQLKETYERWQVFFQDEVGIEGYSAFVRAAEAVANDLSAKFLPQPEDTLTPVFTNNLYRVEFKPKYESDAYRRSPRANDMFHLNSIFGHRVVKQIEPLLTVASRTESTLPAGRHPDFSGTTSPSVHALSVAGCPYGLTRAHSGHIDP